MAATLADTAPTSRPPSPSTRLLVRLLAVAFAVALVSVAGLSLLAALGRQTTEETRSFGDVVVRRVDARAAGTVRILPAHSVEVGLRGRQSWSFAAPRTSEELRGDTLVLAGTCRTVGLCRVDYDLWVPPCAVVSAQSTAGDLEVSGLGAGAQLESSAGDVRLSGGAGDVELRSSAGSVVVAEHAGGRVEAESSAGEVRLSFTVAPDWVLAESSAGDVLVEVPVDAGPCRVAASSATGDTNGAVDRDPAAARSIDARSSAGDVRVRYR